MSFVLSDSFPLYVANRPESPNRDLAVVDKFTGATATRVALADPATIDRAIASAVAAEGPMRRLPPDVRKSVLDHCVARFTARAEELAWALLSLIHI